MEAGTTDWSETDRKLGGHTYSAPGSLSLQIYELTFQQFQRHCKQNPRGEKKEKDREGDFGKIKIRERLGLQKEIKHQRRHKSQYARLSVPDSGFSL